jgi:histone H3/H4
MCFEVVNEEKDEIYPNKGGINMPLPKATVDKMIRKAGAYRVSEGAALKLASYLEEVATEIGREAVILAEHAGRKTVKL